MTSHPGPIKQNEVAHVQGKEESQGEDAYSRLQQLGHSGPTGSPGAQTVLDAKPLHNEQTAAFRPSTAAGTRQEGPGDAETVRLRLLSSIQPSWGASPRLSVKIEPAGPASYDPRVSSGNTSGNVPEEAPSAPNASIGLAQSHSFQTMAADAPAGTAPVSDHLSWQCHAASGARSRSDDGFRGGRGQARGSGCAPYGQGLGASPLAGSAGMHESAGSGHFIERDESAAVAARKRDQRTFEGGSAAAYHSAASSMSSFRSAEEAESDTGAANSNENANDVLAAVRDSAFRHAGCPEGSAAAADDGPDAGSANRQQGGNNYPYAPVREAEFEAHHVQEDYEDDRPSDMHVRGGTSNSTGGSHSGHDHHGGKLALCGVLSLNTAMQALEVVKDAVEEVREGWLQHVPL